jgi:hypothetical protein
VLVEFMLGEEEADTLLADLRREQVALFYARLPGEFGNT